MSITVNANNNYYSSANGLLLSKDGKTLLEGINGDVVIPASVTTIETGAFQGRNGLTSVWFESSPPACSSAFSGTQVRGYYPYSLTSEWLPQIENGGWRGLIMTAYGVDFIVRLHGNGATTMDGTDWVDLPMTFGKAQSLPDNPFSKAIGDSVVFPSRDISHALLGWRLGSGMFNWRTDKTNIIPLNEIISASESQLLDWARLGWADVNSDGIPTVHLYAIWQSEIEVQVRGSDGNQLSPQSLESVTEYEILYGEEDWRMGEGSFSVPPGQHGIGVKLEAGFDKYYTVQLRINGSLISPSLDNSWLFDINSSRGPQVIHLQLELDTSANLGFVQFDVFGTDLTVAQTAAWPMFPQFDSSMVDIAVFATEGSNWGGMSVPDGDIIPLPEGSYRVRIGYKARPGEYGLPYWSMCESYWDWVDVQVSCGELKTVRCPFLPFGSTEVNAYWILLNGNGGNVFGNSPLWWFMDWSGSEVGNLSDYPLPEAKRTGGWKFDGWQTNDGVLVADWRVLEQMLRQNPDNLELQAKWTAVQAATGAGTVVPYEWLENEANMILTSVGGDYEAAAIALAANDQPVWKCYLAGLDVEDTEACFEATIDIVDGKPVVKPSPDLGTNRVYTIEAKTSLSDEEWGEPYERSRFFRIRVALPE